MSDPQFDDHLRNTLSGHRTPLDTGALWDRLSPLLAEDKKRRRGFFWWWAGAAALVLALGWVTWRVGEGATGGGGDFATVRPADDNDSPLGAGGVAGRRGEGATNVGSFTDSLTAEFRRVTQSNHRGKKASAHPPRNSAKLYGEKISLELFPKLTTLDVATLQPANDKNSPLGAGGATLGLYDCTTERGGDVATNVASFTDSLTAEFRRVTQSNHRGKKASAHPLRNSAKLCGEKISLEFFPKLTTLDVATLGLYDDTTVRRVDGGVHQANVAEIIGMRKFQLIREAEILQIPAAVIPEKPTRKKTAFVLRPEAGAGLVFKSLQSHPGDSSNYRQARLDTEDALEYVSAGLLAGVQHRSGGYAFAGLGYTRINERFYTSGSRTEYDSIPDGIVEIYIDSNGDSIITRGSVPVTRYITYRKRTYNQYTLLEVPILLGYQWQQDRWSLGVEGGVYVNLVLQSRGDILSENGDIISLQDADNVMRPRIGLSYFGSLRLGFAFDDKTQLSLAPSLRVLPSLTASDYSLNQKYTLLGLNVGLTRKF